MGREDKKPLKTLYEALQWENSRRAWFSFWLTVLGLILLIPAYYVYWIYALFAAFALVPAIFLFFRYLQHMNITENSVYRLAEDDPDAVTWIYAVETQLNPWGIELSKTSEVILNTREKTDEKFVIPSRKLQGVMRAMNRLFPKASFGYTDERAMQYNENPELLRQDFNPLQGGDENLEKK